MRRVFNVAARGVLAVCVVTVLAIPAEAKTRESAEPKKGTPVVQMLKKLAIKVFGDGLTIPRP